MNKIIGRSYRNLISSTVWYSLAIFILSIIPHISSQCPKDIIGVKELVKYACDCQNGEELQVRTRQGAVYTINTSFNTSNQEFSLEFGRRNASFNIFSQYLNGPKAVRDRVYTIFPHTDVMLLKELSNTYETIRINSDLTANFYINQGPVNVTFYTFDVATKALLSKCIDTPNSDIIENSSITLCHGKYVYCKSRNSQSICGRCSMPARNAQSEQFLLRAIKINNTPKRGVFDTKSAPSVFDFSFNHYIVLLRVGYCRESKSIPIRPPNANVDESPGVSETPRETETSKSNDYGLSLPRNSVCGIDRNFRERQARTFGKKPSWRILGGTAAQPNSWLWVAALYHDVDQFFCGGTILAPGIVITAAHCFINFRTKREIDRLRVRVGKYNITIKENTQQNRSISQLIIHEEFNRDPTNEYKNDIALVVLRKPLKFNKNTINVCLNDGFYPINESPQPDCIVTGWGNMERNEKSTVLRQLDVNLISREVCNAKKSMNNKVIDGMFCAGSTEGKDACEGDSGGPLQCFNRQEKRWYLTGIVSWGIGCGLPNKYGVYTNVKEFLPWINAKIRELQLNSSFLSYQF